MDVLRLLADARNQAILSLLHAEPSYARRVAQLVEYPEPEVTRRLRRMEKAGLVSGTWQHIGKNVKMYRPTTSDIRVTLGAEGMHVALGDAHVIRHDPVPLGMPPVPEIAGRDAELEMLHQAWPTCLVLGMPGIGKTAVAAAYAHQAAPAFWHAFRGAESVTWLATRFALFVAQRGDSTLLEAVRDSDPLDHARLLEDALVHDSHVVVLDDLHRAEQPLAGILRVAMGQKRAGQLVVTSRQRPAGLASPGLHTLELTGVPDAAVQRIVGPCDAPLVRRLQKQLGGHPLALHLLRGAAQHLGVGPGDLLDRAPSTEIQAYLLEELDKGLSEGERRVLGAACIMIGPFTHKDLAAVNPRARATDLASLQRQCLVGQTAEGAVLHDIVRAFFYARLDDPIEMHLAAAGHAAQKGTAGGRIEAMHHWMVAGRRDKVLELVSQNLDVREHDLLHSRHATRYSEILHSFERQDVPDDRTWALLCDERGDLDFSQGEWEEALRHYDEADAYFQQNKDGWEDEDLAWKRAMALQRLGRLDEASRAVAEALKDAPPSGRPRERLEKLQAELDATALPA